MNTYPKSHHIFKQSGFTLTELMIALVLGLVVAGAAAIVFLQAKRNFLQNEQVSRIQENGRYALKVLVRDISLAGFLGEQWDLSRITNDSNINLSAGSDCGPDGWFADLTSVIQVADGDQTTIPAPPAVTTVFPCIDNADHLAGTDAFSIKRTADSYTYRQVLNATTECDTGDPCCGTGSPPVAPAACGISGNSSYLRTNNLNGLIYHDPVINTGAQPAVTREDWQYLVHVYYIRPYSVDGDNIPTLCREVLRNKAFTNQCLAEGIENLQIDIGLDTDGDGVVNIFTARPTAAQLQQAVMARIHILVRANQALRSADVSNKTYNLGTVTVGPFADNFYRRVFSTQVQLRNITNRNALGL